MCPRLCFWLLFSFAMTWAGNAHGQTPVQQPEAPARAPDKSLPTGTLPTAEWLKASTDPITAAEIDKLIQAELSRVAIKPAAQVSDTVYLRRVFLDLTGRPPTPSDIQEFLADSTPGKKAKLVDRLLASDEYARHWARYWTNVVTSRQADQRAQAFAVNFENWLTAQFKKNRSWGLIVDDMITARDSIRLDDRDKNGQAFFVSIHLGADAKTELAAETSRIFLGIQIQCAQCHNHPSDIWKRQDFHEFTAYFARVRSQPFQENKKLAGLKIVSVASGEHQMPSKEDPKKGVTVHPRFLQGRSPAHNLGDLARRQALASAIISQDNPWFAGAYVNRIWGELMGQAFAMPIDDLGPEKDVVLPSVLARVSGAFRGSAYNMKKLFRAIVLSEVYRRQIRPGETEIFASATQPTRLQADTLWHALTATLGPFALTDAQKAKAKAKGPLAGQALGLENNFKREFGYDPSTKPADVEGSISQALLLMNNPQINQKIQAKGENTLARILAEHADNDAAVKAVYLRTLARQPTARELTRCREYITRVGNRSEAFEDILWTLINSTEFQTRR